MNSRNLPLIIAGIIVLAIGGGAIYATTRNNSGTMSGMSSSSSMDMSSNGASIKDATESSTVNIKDFAFAPQAIKIKAGTKVTWTNQDTIQHNAIKDKGQKDGPDGPLLSKGESYSYTFKKAGTYTYHCMPHLSMKATVFVTE